ncbi:Elongator protein 3/MiaB/NifB [Moorella glycerini]|uniref:Ribosomal protein S12 methylthiotransferase RimO n=1 Tax=Neomoorella stamsii TaxID=1266720 RepID=A0A9X7J3F7_9FIRM|nr:MULTISPECIES: radical SAM protein [Moorella]PRR72804.1 Ribosomal protein S12 methylthiotransferase RimO [Moorella stamsii]CEP66259.1 Elongator protein 3/MiaB/NifB [Moorella glycerini]CEP68149.1 Elongator protein 3/MiaB/NifB [Moorella glycerini]
MKILLLEHPRSICPERCNDIANTPLSSSLLTGYSAAMLRGEGHEVEIVEGYLDGLSYKEIEQRLSAMEPDILGVHMVYHWKSDVELFGFLEKVKREGFSRYITVYGFYPTFAFAEILQRYLAIDSVIIGEPELTFAELAGALSWGACLADIPGLALRDRSGNISYLRRKPVEDLDHLPFPVRTEAMFRLPEVNLQGSRGCYGGCTFCYINPFYGHGSRWRGRSPENIVAELDRIMLERGRKEFYFVDPNFFGPGQEGQKRALRLASLLKTRNIRFGIEARVNDIHEETISALVEAGLRHILIGLESGTDHSLRRLNKMTTVTQNERALRILRQHGIEPNVGFIMFEPDSTLENVRANFEFLQRNHLLKSLPVTANLLYHHQIILRGTPFYQKLEREGRLQTTSFSSYEGINIFDHAKVADLAYIMRRITNFLFNRMEGIWSGKVAEPGDTREKYAKINYLLVNTFETVLKALEAGEQFPEELKDLLVRKAENEIDEILTYTAS